MANAARRGYLREYSQDIAAHRAEMARLAAILRSTEACGRELLAAHLAFKTAMPPDEALDVLRVAPRYTGATVLLTAAGKRHGLTLSAELFRRTWDVVGYG